MATVSVGCKLPHGIQCQLFKVNPGHAAEAVGPRVVLRGANSTISDGLIVHAGSFGVTEGVDKDFIEKWLKDNADLKAVKDGHIFIHANAVSVRAEGKAKAKTKTGFEGLDKDALPAGLEKATATEE